MIATIHHWTYMWLYSLTEGKCTNIHIDLIQQRIFMPEWLSTIYNCSYCAFTYIHLSLHYFIWSLLPYFHWYEGTSDSLLPGGYSCCYHLSSLLCHSNYTGRYTVQQVLHLSALSGGFTSTVGKGLTCSENINLGHLCIDFCCVFLWWIIQKW